MSGVIYKITCKTTGQSYIGQACDKKHRKGIPYNYGMNGRWSDHVSSAKSRTTPLALAIRQYGRDDFTITELERGELVRLDELEAKWIAAENTITPNGFNVAVHGRNKHHLSSTLASHYREIVSSATLRPIKCDGVNKLVYLNLTLKDGSTQRIVFGQQSDHTYEVALQNARQFAAELQCPVKELLDQATKYADKLAELAGQTITDIRITTASSLIAVYVTTSEMKSYKDQLRVCFGGKTVSREDAYHCALEFVNSLTLPPDVKIQDLVSISPQQATAP
jgi:hypothetical protein